MKSNQNKQSGLLADVKRGILVPRLGRLTQFLGLAAESMGPDAFLGEICEVYSPVQAISVETEVVGFREGKLLLMPYGSLDGIYAGSEIVATGRRAGICVGPGLIGHVIDAFGNFLDASGCVSGELLPLYARPINPLERDNITDIFETGVKAIDTFLTIGRGQRMGLFAGSGVGKSTLLGMLIKHAKADVNVVALIGERGREVAEFVSNEIGRQGMRNTIVIAATADQHPLLRTRAAYVAHAIAEFFRSKGKHVLLAMDSMTRFAMAQREIGLAIGEPPTVRGYTPSVFSSIPKLVERCGALKDKGSITALYTVLMEGDDLADPVVDHVRAILDGQIVLSRDLAGQGHYPAVDLSASISRLRDSLIKPKEKTVIVEALKLINVFNSAKDMIDMGMYKPGQNNVLDKAIKIEPRMNEFLRQDPNSHTSRQAAFKTLSDLIA